MRLGLKQIIEICRISEISKLNPKLELCSANRYRNIEGCNNGIRAKLCKRIKIRERRNDLLKKRVEIKHRVLALIEIGSVDRDIIYLCHKHRRCLIKQDLGKSLKFRRSLAHKINNVVCDLLYIDDRKEIIFDKACKCFSVNRRCYRLYLAECIEFKYRFRSARSLYDVNNVDTAGIQHLHGSYACAKSVKKLRIIGNYLRKLIRSNKLYKLFDINVLPIVINVNSSISCKRVLQYSSCL